MIDYIMDNIEFVIIMVIIVIFLSCIGYLGIKITESDEQENNDS